LAKGPEIAGRATDVVIALDGKSGLNDVLKSLMAQGGSILACDRIEPDLEEAFARLLAEETAKEIAKTTAEVRELLKSDVLGLINHIMWRIALLIVVWRETKIPTISNMVTFSS
jgi:hypothetical protein